jgi:hypothetical protein
VVDVGPRTAGDGGEPPEALHAASSTTRATNTAARRTGDSLTDRGRRKKSAAVGQGGARAPAVGVLAIVVVRGRNR